eukprot:TRINITY_DN11255_c0_g1_i2.p1 TRINITY_DN11255_c0_g1~~TRINITY_DN11255_c0_g1_i2.p1  ORF type:complete len:173 (-),score=43.55 TRINITY_DN11255_c0_g1_i2:486-1004(-)
MTERKIRLETHTNLTTSLYDHVRRRKLDHLNDTELQIMTSKTISAKVRGEIAELLRSRPVEEFSREEGKSVENGEYVRLGGMDRLRVLLIYVLCSEDVREEDVRELENVLTSSYPGISLNSLAYLKSKSLANARVREEDYGGFGRLFSSKLSTEYRRGQEWTKHSERVFINK